MESGCSIKGVSSAAAFQENAAAPFVIPSEAEGPAVLRTSPGNVWRPLLAARLYSIEFPAAYEVPRSVLRRPLALRV